MKLAIDLALLTGTIQTGALEDYLASILTTDKLALAEFHRYISDPEVLKAILVFLAEGVQNDIPF